MKTISKSTTNVFVAVLITAGLLLSALEVSATSHTVSGLSDDNVEKLSVFEEVIVLPPTEIVVPTVVELPLADNQISPNGYLVLEQETNTFIGSRYFSSYENVARPLVSTTPQTGNRSNMIDNLSQTYSQFEVPVDGEGVVTIRLTMQEPFTTSRLNLGLAEHTALPLTVTVEATGVIDNKEGETSPFVNKLVATKKLTNSVVQFPETTARDFIVTFTYAQPLRISEINFVPSTNSLDKTQSLRFLAQPDTSYEVFLNPEFAPKVQTTETGNLSSINDEVLILSSSVSARSNRYIPADFDEDGIVDRLDNCVRVANGDQVDIDRNGRGDACDDFDRDGRLNNVDNCINQPNRAQQDEDGDGIGDACDTEESRFTERNPWVPWVGMGTAGAVILVLFILVAKGTRRIEEEVPQNEPDSNEGIPEDSNPSENRLD